jgi:nicotinamide mononucleotide transporter
MRPALALWLKWGGTALLAAFLLTCRALGWLPFSWLEIIGALTGFISVILAIDQRISTFPVGIVSNLLFALLFLHSNLYGSMIVQLIYLVLCVHGWLTWHRSAALPPLPISRLTLREALALVAIFIPAVALFTWYLHSISSSLPFLDAGVNILSLNAQYLLNRKRLEIWAVGIVADLLYITLYILQQLWLVAALYLFYLALCIIGYRVWRQAYAEQILPEPEPQLPASV